MTEPIPCLIDPGVPAITKDSGLVVLPHAVNREFSVTPQMIDIGWVIDNRISKLPLPDGEPSTQKQLGLDIRGNAVGDAYAAAFSPDQTLLVVTAEDETDVREKMKHDPWYENGILTLESIKRWEIFIDTRK